MLSQNPLSCSIPKLKQWPEYCQVFIPFLLTVLLVSCGGADDIGGVTIYVENGARQCEFNGKTLDETAQLLIANGIEVLESGCGELTNVAFPAVCGAPTGEINLHRIREQQQSAAERLGFQSVEKLSENGEPGYKELACQLP